MRRSGANASWWFGPISLAYLPRAPAIGSVGSALRAPLGVAADAPEPGDPGAAAPSTLKTSFSIFADAVRFIDLKKPGAIAPMRARASWSSSASASSLSSAISASRPTSRSCSLSMMNSFSTCWSTAPLRLMMPSSDTTGGLGTEVIFARPGV